MKLLLISSIFLTVGLASFLEVDLDVDSSSAIFDREGRILSLELSRDDKFRYWRALKDIDPRYRRFVLEKEDRYFFWHPGINPIALAEATLGYIKGDKKRGGASTITMQLARLYYDLETQNPKGKIKQIFAAFWLEFTMSKKAIFEAYLNLIPMGRNIEGFETASLYYFNKSGRKLSEVEFHFLTLLPQRPYLIYSYFQKKWSNFEQGWSLLYPTLPFETSKQLLKDLKLFQNRPSKAQHFVRVVKNLAKMKSFKTSLDIDWQFKTEKILQNYIRSKNSRGIFNATSMIIDSESGEVLTYIGSADFNSESIQGQVDGLMANRSPGSTLKPFIYALAIEQGNIHPYSIVFDSPLPYRTPENYDRTFKGPITAEEALVTSRNIPAVALNNELQRNNQGLYSFLNLIYPQSKDKGHFGSSIALGALEVNAWKLGELYMALSNNGTFKKLTFFPSRKYEERENESFPILSEEASVMVKDMLRKNPRPQYQNSQAFSERKGEVYWKTGTSFGFRDAWAVGIWQKYVIVSWVGDFESKSNPYLVGSISAAPLFFQLVDFLRSEGKSLKDYDLKHLYHKNVSEVEVCALSGRLPNPNCRAKVKSIYWPGRSPIDKCHIHKKITLAKDSELRACPQYKGLRIERVFEFLSSESQALHESYGIRLKTPPKYHPLCSDFVNLKEEGRDPVIISPKVGFTYIREANGEATIPLKASGSMGTKTLSWYLEEELLGKSLPGKAFTTSLKSGNYLLRVIDSSGREAKRIVRVR